MLKDLRLRNTKSKQNSPLVLPVYSFHPWLPGFSNADEGAPGYISPPHIPESGSCLRFPALTHFLGLVRAWFPSCSTSDLISASELDGVPGLKRGHFS